MCRQATLTAGQQQFGSPDANVTGAVDNNDFSIPSDVRADMAAQEAAEALPLWNDDAIDCDIAHVIRSCIAPKSRKTYNDYTVRLIIFLFDQREKFPNLICQDFLERLIDKHQCGSTNLTRAGRIKKGAKNTFVSGHQGCS